MSKEKVTEEIDKDVFNLFSSIDISNSDLTYLINELNYFNSELKSLKKLELFLNSKNVNTLKQLRLMKNIKVNLILSKIYINIINNETLYSNYLLDLKEDDNKINLLLTVIEECISLIEDLKWFIFSQELFEFKINVISLIKCLSLNCKNKISKKNLNKIEKFLDISQKKFFSKEYNKLNKDKEIYKIWESKDIEKINIFEKKFCEINNYFEQLKVFQSLVENNIKKENYDSVSITESGDIKLNPDKKQENLDLINIDFYQEYGLFIQKFFKYHKYIFLLEDNTESDKKEEKEEEDEEEENERLVFLLDNINTEEGKSEHEGKTIESKKDKLENFINKKKFLSILESKEYIESIKKEIIFYLNNILMTHNNPKIKPIISQIKDFFKTTYENIFTPLYIKRIKTLEITDYFTPSFSINIPEGKKQEIYLETIEGETMLLYLEFSEKCSKDINFEFNKYEIKEKNFKQIFKKEKIEETLKLFVICKGYSIYQIIFDNYYSWFTSKDIDYKISLLKLIDTNKNDNNKIYTDSEKIHLDKAQQIQEKLRNLENNTTYGNKINSDIFISNINSENEFNTQDIKGDKINCLNIRNPLKNLASELINVMPNKFNLTGNMVEKPDFINFGNNRQNLLYGLDSLKNIETKTNKDEIKHN